MADQIVVASTEGDDEALGSLVREYRGLAGCPLRRSPGVRRRCGRPPGGWLASRQRCRRPTGLRRARCPWPCASSDQRWDHLPRPARGVVPDEGAVRPRPFPGAGHRAVAVPEASGHGRHGYRLLRRDTGNQSSGALTMGESLGFPPVPGVPAVPGGTHDAGAFLARSHWSKAYGREPAAGREHAKSGARPGPRSAGRTRVQAAAAAGRRVRNAPVAVSVRLGNTSGSRHCLLPTAPDATKEAYSLCLPSHRKMTPWRPSAPTSGS